MSYKDEEREFYEKINKLDCSSLQYEDFVNNVVLDSAPKIHNAIHKFKQSYNYEQIRDNKDSDVGGDICFDNLPKEIGDENYNSAKEACVALLEILKKKKIFDIKILEETSEIVHNQWLARNKECNIAEQKFPYNQLSENEKEKDRIVVRCVFESIKNLL